MKKLLLPLLFGFIAYSTQAAAVGLIGDEITVTWINTNNFWVDQEKVIVSDTVELENQFSSNNLDVSAWGISVNMTYPITGLGSGIRWTFSDLDFSGVEGGLIEVIVSTDFIGWSDSFLSFTSSKVQIDFLSNVTIPQDSNYFNLSLITAPAEVPVPAAFWLFSAALLGVVGIKRR